MIENEELQKGQKNSKPEHISGIINRKEKPNKNFEYKGVIYPKNYNMPILEDQVDSLLYNINNYALLVNKLDFYGNSIPLGAFCFALSFIMYGFFECKIHKTDDKFLYIILLLFGGIGEIITGLFEYIKGRTFPSNLYLIYGIYFICFYFVKSSFKDNSSSYTKECYRFFYGSWAGLTFPLLIGSLNTNVFYLLQTFFVCALFVVKCIGACYDVDAMNGLVSGILEIIVGAISLYICINQIINESLGFQLLPSFNIIKDNEIDLDINKDKDKEKDKDKGKDKDKDKDKDQNI